MPGGGLGSTRVHLGLTSWETGKFAPTSGRVAGLSHMVIPSFHDPSYRALNRLVWCSRHGTKQDARQAAQDAARCAAFGKEGAAAAALGRCVGAALDGAYRQAAFHAAEAQAAAQAADQVDLSAIAAIMLIRFAPLCGQAVLAVEAARQMLKDAQTMGLPAPEFATYAQLTMLSHAQGDLLAAEQHRQRASLSAVAYASARTQAKRH